MDLFLGTVQSYAIFVDAPLAHLEQLKFVGKIYDTVLQALINDFGKLGRRTEVKVIN